jgi:hypothetical protein
MYFQSSYYYFFFPLALASLCYEWFISRLRVTSLCAHVLVWAYKPIAEAAETSRIESPRTEDTTAYFTHQ